jgi:precorrin-2 dehydrogenase/sirohydrochlorin ferrochelatase
MKAYYPVYLDIEGRKCVVVGGGSVAARKSVSLAAAGAKVTVVSPVFCRALEEQAKQGRATLKRNRFQAKELDGAFVVIACTDDRKVNDRVYRAAKQREILVNVVDSAPQCDFIVPSVVSRGGLTIAISTSGVSPALSRRIREFLEKKYGRGYARFLSLMEKHREVVLRECPATEQRKEIFEALTQADFISEITTMTSEDAKQHFEETLKALLAPTRSGDV